jgi:hypothetical protein
MYSQEDRLRAVKLYLELDSNAALTVRRLGYPDVKKGARFTNLLIIFNHYHWLSRWFALPL